MFVQRVALDAVPSYAVVDSPTLAATLRDLSARDGAVLQGKLDSIYRRLECEQPALSEFIGDELSEIEGGAGQALAYFLFLAVYLSFERAFGPHLRTIDGDDMASSLQRLVVDGEVRSALCAGSYSEDAIALGQPALMGFVCAELDKARDTLPTVEPIGEALLIEILALTSAVAG